MSMTRLLLCVPVFLVLACTTATCPEGTVPRGAACVVAMDARSMDASSESEPDAGEDAGIEDGVDTGEPIDGGGTVLDSCTEQEFFRDADEDGNGDPEASISACERPDGYVESSNDCDDSCPSCHPGGVEECDGRNQDCDEAIDEGLPETTSYADVDGDTYGDDETAMTGCSVPEGRVARAGDCNDELETVYPSATETCNGIDDDCDERTDEGLLRTFFRDADGDEFGTASIAIQACTQPSGYVMNNEDCNDACRTCRPNGPEVCDELDNDCDTRVDEYVTTTYYADCDGDGYAPRGASSYEGCTVRTSRPAGCALAAGTWTSRSPTVGNRDCLDTNPSVYPNNPAYYSSPASGHSPPYDYNCDGVETQELTQVDGHCTSAGFGHCDPPHRGWTTTTVPACGEMGDYVTGCGSACFPQFLRQRQSCR